MQVEPSGVPGIELIGQESARFRQAVASVLGHDPCPVLEPALPYSVVVTNTGSRTVAFLGVRFDMRSPRQKPWTVIHYADTLRNPESADLRSGASRYVCAEPLYTDMVLRRSAEVDKRGPMNLSNLQAATEIRASLDSVAFVDGGFAGPDALGAYERFALETLAETRLVEEILRPDASLIPILEGALDIPVEKTRDRALVARRNLARRIAEGLALGGIEEALSRARHHRPRIPLHRDMR